MEQELLGFSELQGAIKGSFGAIKGRFEAIKGRFEAIKGRFESIEGSFEAIKGKFKAVKGDLPYCLDFLYLLFSLVLLEYYCKFIYWRWQAKCNFNSSLLQDLWQSNTKLSVSLL